MSLTPSPAPHLTNERANSLRRGLQVLAAATIVWFLGATRPVQNLEGWIYDHYTVLQARWSSEQSQVLLVYAEAGKTPKDDSSWLALVESLWANGARRIIFAGFPTGAGIDFYRGLGADGPVLFGRAVARDALGPGENLQLEKVPTAALERPVSVALWDPATGHVGVHRSYYRYRVIAGERFATVQSLASADQAQSDTPPEELISFLPAPDAFPRVSLSRLAAGDVVPELVEGMTVLIGGWRALDMQRLATPLTIAGWPLTALELNAYALNTALAGSAPRTTARWLDLLILTVIALLSFATAARLGLNFLALASTVALLLSMLTAGVLLAALGLWLPVGEIVVTLALTLALLFRSQAMEQHRLLRSVIADVESRLRDRLIADQSKDAHSRWSLISTLLQQTLDLDRAVFLERLAPDHRVREVESIGCEFSDIRERRRDYHRYPYTQALQERAPVHLFDRPFFDGCEDQHQYLAPIMVGDEVLGFWAFVIPREKVLSMPNIDSVLRNFNDQISQVVFHEAQRAALLRPQRSLLARLLIPRPSGPSTGVMLSGAVKQLENRLAALEDIANSLNNATVVYDLFGRVLHANRRMIQLAERHDLRIYQMTALDLTTRMTAIDRGMLRLYLRHLVLEHEPIRLSTALGADSGEEFLLTVRPVLREELSEQEVAPFKVSGFLLELQSVDDLKSLYRLKDTLIERYAVRQNNDLASIVCACDLLAQDDLESPQRQRLAAIVDEKVRDSVHTLGEVNRYLSDDLEAPSLERYPVDLPTALRTCVDGMEAALERKAVRCEIDNCPALALVLAPPEKLTTLLSAVLSVLADDCVEGSTLRLRTTQQANTVTLSLTNEGFGLPNDRLQAYLDEETENDAAGFRRLREGMDWLQRCGGKLEAQGEIGVGLCFRIRFEGFL